MKTQKINLVKVSKKALSTNKSVLITLGGASAGILSYIFEPNDDGFVVLFDLAGTRNIIATNADPRQAVESMASHFGVYRDCSPNYLESLIDNVELFEGGK